jgi:hypothetical protein
MFRSVPPKAILAQLKMRWKLHFVEYVDSDEHRYVLCLLCDVLLTRNDHPEVGKSGGKESC